MGAGQSAVTQANSSHALHVLRVTPSSPASQTNIEPFFDFIVGFNEGEELPDHNDLDASELERIVEQHEERTLNLLVWNSKTRVTRVVPIIPSRGWALEQHASIPHDESEPAPQPSLLGLSMRMCEFENAMDNVWHVLEVLEGSPAESAGLVPYGDWIIGWSGGVLTTETDFYDVVEAHVEKPLQVYVYSYDFDNLREVVLVPNRHWGGEGLLGCVFGFGLLHRIPSQPADRNLGNVLSELQESHSDAEDKDIFVPADVSQDPDMHHVLAPGRSQSSFSTHGDSALYSHTYAGDIRRTADSPHRQHSQPGTPRRSSTPGPTIQTPIAGRPHGSPLNGTGTTGLYTFASPSPLQFSSSVATLRGQEHDENSDEEDYFDGTQSIAGTETTDYGSLTSVE
ncbi:GRASP55/65 PDZ-like domain-containing protein [Hygrophoropsis aurantiaca]|uniref:GRASP55/65 PDZ-like domain-containing protein n=1 Tax=Hygrophoropsis aurantiaca TaxID=72124 RepID=A0ACB8AL69_9AGAM|nr:GRASP55/65 PDZ-like domain-containing protein [Hygrophoropsis aurantiaca]